MIRIENGIAQGTLRQGITIGGVAHRDFEMKECTLGDMLDAEKDAPVGQALAYTVELVCRQLVRIGDHNGPITAAQLRKLPPDDWETLQDARQKLADAAKNALSDSAGC